MEETIFYNRKKIETLKNYLYGNRLSGDEIDRRLTEFYNNANLAGINRGALIQRNVNKRINNAQQKIRTNKFNKLFEELEEKQSQKLMDKKK